MKQHLLVTALSLMTAFTSFSAQAGAPDKDPIVAKIQKDFLNSPQVTLQALQNNWDNCRQYVAAEGNVSIGIAPPGTGYYFK